MTRDEIIEKLEQWADSGLLCSKRGTEMTYTELKRAVGKGEMFATSFDTVVARVRSVRDEFEDLVREGRVMNLTMVTARTGLTTSYKINIACAEGKIRRFGKLGNAAVLYIN